MCDCGCGCCFCECCECDNNSILGTIIFLVLIGLSIWGYVEISNNKEQARTYAIAVSISLAVLIILFCVWRKWSNKKRHDKAVAQYYAQQQMEQRALQGYPPQFVEENQPPAYVNDDTMANVPPNYEEYNQKSTS
jgi:hypothetical protein